MLHPMKLGFVLSLFHVGSMIEKCLCSWCSKTFFTLSFPSKQSPRKKPQSLPERKRMKTSLKLQNKKVLSTNNAFYYQMLCNLKTKNKSKYYFYLSVCMCYIIDTFSKVNFFCFCFRNAH